MSAVIPEVAKYRLSLEDGTPAKNSEEVNGKDLKRVEVTSS